MEVQTKALLIGAAFFLVGVSFAVANPNYLGHFFYFKINPSKFRLDHDTNS